MSGISKGSGMAGSMGKGKGKHTAASANFETGIPYREEFAGTDPIQGMDSSGKNQVPQGISKGSISTDRGSFNTR